MLHNMYWSEFISSKKQHLVVTVSEDFAFLACGKSMPAHDSMGASETLLHCKSCEKNKDKESFAYKGLFL